LPSGASKSASKESHFLSGSSALAAKLAAWNRPADIHTGRIEVILSALVYAKILEEHAAVADLTVNDRTIRQPDQRRPDVRPNRERFFRQDGRLRVLAVVEFGEVPAIIVTVSSATNPPS
jgi:hypothetical protein